LASVESCGNVLSGCCEGSPEEGNEGEDDEIHGGLRELAGGRNAVVVVFVVVVYVWVGWDLYDLLSAGNSQKLLILLPGIHVCHKLQDGMFPQREFPRKINRSSASRKPLDV
jgi:hypothetical protein